MHSVCMKTRRDSKFNSCTVVNQSRQLVIMGFLSALCSFLSAWEPAARLDEVREIAKEDKKSFNKRTYYIDG